MVIDKITDSRDSHFTIYKQVEASGLAFAELGKVGYKLELTKDIVLDEIKAAQDIHKWDKEYDNPPKLQDDKTIVTNINYWLDKVFPNQKDENNNITKWLTPWCYEIRMDWRYYAEDRDSSKIYDDAFISNWTVQGVGDKATLVPTEKTEQQEKARLIDCKNSNKYNITQDIAEAFEVFCRYEYKCDQNGKFIKTYTDDEGKVWTGRKVIFYNRAIKQEDPIVVDYQKNLQSIERTSDSSEIYTKLYVTKLEAEEMSNGYVTIADTTANPLRDEFILNFDYLDNTGALNDYQRQFIGLYKTGIAEANRKLIPLFEAEEEGVADLVELKAKASFYEHEETAAQEEYKYYKDLYDNFNKLGPVVKDKDNSYSAIFIEETKDSNCYYASLGLHGINAESIKLYPDYKYAKDKILNNADNTKIVYSVPDTLRLEEVDNNLYIQLNEYGYPKRLYCHKGSIFNVGTAYLGLEYTPENEYETIYQYFENKILAAVKDKAEYENIVATKVEELKKLEESVQALLKLKDDFNSKLERILGPALREGYWTPDEYEDHASQVIEEFENSSVLEPFWDTEAYSFETDGSYFINGVEGGRKYYPYIKLNESGIDFSNNAPNKLILYENGELQSAPIITEIPAGWKWFQIGDVRYYINLPKQTPPAVGEEQKYFIFIKDNDNVSFTLPDKTTYTLADSGVFRTTAPSGDTVPNPIPELRPAFDNINRNWTAHYYGVHFKYGYINKEPCIILLTEDGNSLNSNSYFSYSFEGDNPTKDVIGGYVCDYDQPYAVEHARIRIREKNVQTTSSLFTIVNLRNEKILERYKDYVVIISDSYPIITLKPNEKNSLEDICGKAYKIGYTSSKANEYMYLDAIQVAKDNSIPRYTYSLQIANLPHDFSHIELGQMLYINDHSLGVHAATGYVNKIEYALDQPQEDGIEVQNYKTKFEDLFSTITAQSEAMKTNRRAYEIAAQAFTSTANGGVMGQISGSVLQSALKNNSYLLNWSATGVEITPDQGIILTNKTPYSNGVTGQVILQGGGIFLSDSVDANGNRIWSQAITPHGINASLINAGQLNTDKILVYAGDNMAFQWNPEGIHAYKIDESGFHKDIYVKYSQHGLHLVNNSLGDWGDNLIDGMKSLVTINWDGLTLKNNDGETTLFADRDGNLSITGTLQSARFASGILGYGWQIRNDGTAEFQDVHVRGTISASVFEYKETTAVGGELYIGPTLVVDYNRAKSAVFSYADNKLTLRVDLGFVDTSTELCGRTWAANDIVGINCCLVNDAGTKYEIKNLRMRLDEIGTTMGMPDVLVSSTLWDTSLNVIYNENGEPCAIAEIDWSNLKPSGPINCIFIGSMNDKDQQNRKGILLTAMAENSPYMDIYDDALSKVNGSLCGVAPKVRLGNLDGLGVLSWKDSFGAELKMAPSGYGLYADNVYLTGTIYATSGKIGSLSIDEVDKTIGQISLVLKSKIGFVYTEATDTKDLYCEVYYGNKLITNKADLPEIYQKKELTFTFSYYSRENAESNWIAFGAPWNSMPLFKDNGEINSLSYTTTNKPTKEYIAVLRLNEEISGQQVIQSDVKIFSYAANGAKGDSIKGDKGDPGTPAKNYYLTADTNSISVDVDGYSPASIIVSAKYSKGNGELQILPTEANMWGVSLLTVDANGNAQPAIEIIGLEINKDQGTCKFNVNPSELKYARRYEVVLYVDGKAVQTLAIPFTLSARMRELGKIVDNEVIINDGKVYANALTAGSVISGKVSAGAIQTGAIAANSTLYLLTRGEGSNSFNMPTEYANKTWTPYEGATVQNWTNSTEYTTALDNGFKDIWNYKKYDTGVRIGPDGVRIRGGGIFEVHMNNFTLDEAGDLTLTGNITATEGMIGGWNLSETQLSSEDNSVYLRSKWEANTDQPIAQFGEQCSITKDGLITANSIEITDGDIQAIRIKCKGYSVPYIIVSDTAPEKPDPDGYNGGCLWLKRVQTEDKPLTTSDTVEFKYDIYGSGAPDNKYSTYRWREHNNLISGNALSETIGKGHRRRVAIMTNASGNRALSNAAVKYQYTLTVPLYLGANAGARVHAALYTSDPFDGKATAGAKLALLEFEPKIVTSGSSVQFVSTTTYDVLAGLYNSQIYMEVWTSRYSSSYSLGNVMNGSANGTNYSYVTLKCEALNSSN